MAISTSDSNWCNNYHWFYVCWRWNNQIFSKRQDTVYIGRAIFPIDTNEEEVKMLDFITSGQKKWVAGLSAIIVGLGYYFPITSLIPAAIQPALKVLPALVILGGAWVLMEETK